MIHEDLVKSIEGLIKECQYYEMENYDFGNHYVFENFTDMGGGIEAILKTPFDWGWVFSKA